MVNPWQVDSIEAFNCLMCPECIFITKEKNLFEKHAVDNHPLSHVLFGLSNENLTDFIEETDKNSKSLQDLNGTTLNTKLNFEAHLDEDSFEISYENIENVKESNDAQGHEGISFNPCYIKYEDSEEISNEIIENNKKRQDAQVHEGIKFNPFDITEEDSEGDSEEISDEMIENESKDTLLCPICGKHFCNQRSKQRHIQTIHEGKKPYRCDPCRVNFSQKGHLNEHIYRIHEKINRSKSHQHELYSCIECDYKCYSNSKLSKHKWSVHKGKFFSCSLCDAAYTTQQNLVIHTKAAHEGKRFSCHMCDSTFTQKHSLKEHIEYAHERKEEVFKCNNCMSEYASQGKLNAHIRKIHEEGKCNICDIKLSKAELDMHVITEHKGKKFRCTICSATFKAQASLLTHTNTVHEEKKFKCHVCDKMFTVKGSLKHHKENVCKGKKRTEK